MNTILPELLREIFKWVLVGGPYQPSYPTRAPSPLSNCRLVCRKFNASATPFVFQHATIHYRNDLDDFIHYLRAIASGRLPYADYAQTLTITRMLGPNVKAYPDIDDHEEQFMDEDQKRIVKNSLYLAISRCCSVMAITWAVEDDTSDYWYNNGIVDAIVLLPLLTSVTLNMNARTNEFFIDSLPPLQTLALNNLVSLSLPGLPNLLRRSSHKLRRLELGMDNMAPTGFISSLFPHDEPLQINSLKLGGRVRLDRASMPSLRGLQSLWHFHSNTTGHDNTWTLLKEEQIHLQHIVHHQADDSFLEYLRSYCGLKSVTFTVHESPTPQALTLVDYVDALRSHATTLEDLIVKPHYEGHWNFTQQSVPALRRLVNLKFLSLAIIADRISTFNFDRPFFYMGQYSPSHPTCILLEAASSLPRLEVLSINFSHIPLDLDMAGNIVGGNMNVHAIHPGTQIDTHVMFYGPLDPEMYKFDLRCSNKYYKVLYVDGDGYRYRWVFK